MGVDENGGKEGGGNSSVTADENEPNQASNDENDGQRGCGNDASLAVPDTSADLKVAIAQTESLLYQKAAILKAPQPPAIKTTNASQDHRHAGAEMPSNGLHRESNDDEDLLYQKAAILQATHPSANNTASEEKQEEFIEAQQKGIVGVGIPDEAKDSVRSKCSVQDLFTSSGVLVERPDGLHRAAENAHQVGAHRVNGMGYESPLQPSPETVDEEAPEQQQQEQADIMVEATLVNSFVHRFSSRRQSRRQTQPVLAHAKPMEENPSLSYRQICTSPKVLIPVGLLVLVAVIAGIAIGIVQSKDDNPQVTSSPTVSPVLEPYDPSLPQSTLDAMQQAGSPQALANTWMWEDDNLNTYSQARQRQRFALATFYYATGGDNWVDSGQWLNHSLSECFWGLRAVKEEGYGLDDDLWDGQDFVETWLAHEEEIVENLAFEERLLACSVDDVMINLVMVPNNLDGTLPPEVFLFLPELQFLDLAWNPLLVGSLPTEVGLLDQLEVIGAYDCSFSGTLPSEIGRLQRLRFLDLYHNQLSGSIPTEIGLLVNLIGISLGSMRITGSIPSELGQIDTLSLIEMEFNDLTGSIPTELLRVGSPIAHLFLSGNEVNGPLPSEISNLKELEALSMNNCGLTGNLPDMSSWTLLRHLEMERNQFTGTISTNIGQLTRLLELWLEDNAISGSLPTEIGGLHKLSEVRLGRNQLSNSLPSELGQMRAMVTLDVTNNQHTETIPAQLGLLERLEKLLLDGTLITGTVPTSLCEKEEAGLLKLEVDCSSVTCC